METKMKYRTTVYVMGGETSCCHATATKAARWAKREKDSNPACCVYDLETRGNSFIARIGGGDEFVTTRTRNARAFAAELARIRKIK